MNAKTAPATRPTAKRPKPARLSARKAADGAAEFRTTVERTFNRLFCHGAVPDTHCKVLDQVTRRYRKRVLDQVAAFIATRRPSPTGATVLYPFSGGDTLSVLAAFPKAERFVLLSLEQGGSPDPLRILPPKRFQLARKRFRFTMERVMRSSFSHTVDLQEPEGKRMPGLLPLLLFGINAHEGKPSGLRTFRIEADGSVRYFTVAELKKAGPWPRGGAKKGRYGRLWSNPDYNLPYSHLELRFRLPGDTKDRVLQHVAVDLSNSGLAASPGLLRFLEQLGSHELMIKAASYLMWKPRYSEIRDAILKKASFLVGDTSAPFPADLRRNGLEPQVFGKFTCTVLRSYRRRAKPWKQEFRRQRPQKPVPFRFGYGDCAKHNHLVLARRATTSK